MHEGRRVNLKKPDPKVMKRYDQVSAFILCGGTSSRMGKPKGLLKFGKQPLILRIASLLEPLVSTVTAGGSPGRDGGLGLHLGDDAKDRPPDRSGKPPRP